MKKKPRSGGDRDKEPAPSEGVTGEKHYSAYKPVKMTDGIVDWTFDNFDNTAHWTKDDIEKSRSVLLRLGPHERIEDMEAMLATLPTDNPAIAMHAAEIRAIHAEVKAEPGEFTLKRLDRLSETYELWTKILILRDLVPKAKQAAKQSQSQSARRKGTGQDHEAVKRHHERLVKNGDHDPTSQTATHFQLSTRQVRNIIKSH
jgi:hypothetical protein